MRVLMTLFLMHCAFFMWAQNEVTEFGNFTPYEINLKQCDFDKDAEAVVLLDKAVSTYNDNYNLITERRVRFKILKERGIERGNVSIRYYSDNSFEAIQNIEAVVLSYDDQKQGVFTSLDRRLVYHKKLNKYYSEASFALPNVKVGSIIEYKYTSIMKSYGGLREWVFQSDIPVLASIYDLTILPNTEFAYGVYKSNFMPIDIKPNSASGSVLFRMSNIPGLREEAYMGSANDYLQRVKFQFSGIKMVNGDGYSATASYTKKYTTTWKELARDLMDERSFGGVISKNFLEAGVAEALWSHTTDSYSRMKAIHDYVKSHFSWNHIYALYAEDGLKTAWEKKTGTSAEINLILINLLKAAGLDVQPLLVSERNFGKIDTTYPYINQFNKVVAYVGMDDQHYILDGTDSETPSFIVPFKLLNTTGFVVNKKAASLYKIRDDKRTNLSFVTITGNISEAGLLQLDGAVSHYDYKKIEEKGKYSRDKSNYTRDFLEPYHILSIDTFAVANLENDSLPAQCNFKIRRELDKTGNYSLLRYNWFTGFDKNPFTREQRFTDINFGCRYACTLSGTFNLPENLTPEALPKPVRLITPDKSMMVARQVELNGNTIHIGVRIEINKTEYSAGEYEQVQGFFKQMLELINEPVVLKAKA